MNKTPDPHALARRIAKLKGWTVVERDDDPGIWFCVCPGNPHGDLYRKIRTKGLTVYAVLKDWPTSLTLAWELEEELTREEQIFYGEMLRAITVVGALWPFHDFQLAHATAAQRCEAWVRVKRKENLIMPEPTELACNDDSCFEKAKARGQQRFTLVGGDKTTPRVICLWIAENIETAPDNKLRHALEDALRARKTPNRKMPD